MGQPHVPGGATMTTKGQPAEQFFDLLATAALDSGFEPDAIGIGLEADAEIYTLVLRISQYTLGHHFTKASLVGAEFPEKLAAEVVAQMRQRMGLA